MLSLPQLKKIKTIMKQKYFLAFYKPISFDSLAKLSRRWNKVHSAIKQHNWLNTQIHITLFDFPLQFFLGGGVEYLYFCDLDAHAKH